MSVKRKPSLDKTEDTKEKVNDEKRVRSESTISHSSWIYRLTAAPTPTPTTTKTKEEEEEEQKVNIELKEKEQSVKTETTSVETTADRTEEEAQKEQEPNLATKIEQNNSSGIWSWLGYSGPPNQSTSDPESAETALTVADYKETKTENEEEKKEEDEQKNITESETPDHHSTASVPPPPRPSYWKSLFASTSTSTINSTEGENKDSVIISDDNTEEQPQQPSIIEQQTEPQQALEEDTAASRKLPIPPSKNNIVLPTFKSQFHSTIPSSTASQDNLNIFSKAINAINSIFTQQKSTKPINSDDWQDIHRLSTMIDSMKSDPENAAGKKIVIIGVHGWFPMKVGNIKNTANASRYLTQIYFTSL